MTPPGRWAGVCIPRRYVVTRIVANMHAAEDDALWAMEHDTRLTALPVAMERFREARADLVTRCSLGRGPVTATYVLGEIMSVPRWWALALERLAASGAA